MNHSEDNPYASPKAVETQDDLAPPQASKVSMRSWLWQATRRGAISGAILWVLLSVSFTFAAILLQGNFWDVFSDRRFVVELIAMTLGMSTLIGSVIGGALGLVVGLLSYLVRNLRSRRRITLLASLLLPPAVLMAPFALSPAEASPPIPMEIAAGVVFFVALGLGARIFWLIDDKLFASGRELAETDATKGDSA
ncbi:hypothetical protein LOC68_00430 [Blastopirellula sp. JC732]|uniref:Uncharacterized protein n=1 Tax=Blastopirellula sediminis TaxID=2894196 RepID=A0A9X1MH32_9BACT|nr:hypothetical protein [Blastopirellula sediminis]MCC9604339.1 hypothetical protein [Blastopirellula sediminis]MCC9626859.1 hypothetical protein [Blastopirellula sediminis]